MRLVEGKCVSATTPCPSHMKENALLECQGCDKNHVDKNNCLTCALSFDNQCLTCGIYLDPLLNLPPNCACKTGFSKLGPIDGMRQQCKSSVCHASANDCFKCDQANKCLEYLTDNNAIINGSCISTNCPVGTYPIYTYLRKTPQ